MDSGIFVIVVINSATLNIRLNICQKLEIVDPMTKLYPILCL
jgi:hypothetical protein